MTTFWLIIWGIFLAHFLSVNLVYLTLLVVGVTGNRRRARQVRNSELHRVARSPLTIPVSVVMPAHNEEDGIEDAVRSVLRSDFPELEVIVVDDGSEDATLDRLWKAFDLEVVDRFYPKPLETRRVRLTYRSRSHPNLWVLEKAQGGKADACNAGINFARYRYVLTTDADCVFHPEAILRTMQPVNFDPGHIVGIGGNLRVMNGLTVRHGRVTGTALPDRLPARFQVLEYATAFLTNRLGWSELNAMHVLSGAFSVWRRDTLLELGGFTSDTTHEDIELTMRVHAHFSERGQDYRMVSLPDPVIWTEVPETWKGLYIQRKRWQRVLFEVVWRYRRMWFNPRYGTMGTLGMPYLLIYEAFGPFIEVAAYILTIVLFALGLVSLELLLVFLALSFGLNALVRIGSLILDMRYHGDNDGRRSIPELLGLCGLAVIEYLVYRPVILAARVVSFFEFLKGHRGWERVERNGKAREARARAA
jgi:cellulose synthase/poly-beta-1,6-N-acetylglucosamine synthase-like glycosyltransferase